MIPLLVASAFAIALPPAPSSQPKTVEIVKPPDDVVLVSGPLEGVIVRPRTGYRNAQFEAILRLLGTAVAVCDQQESLAVVRREGGFKSGFGPLPPGANPPAPLTSAGFW